MNTGFHNSRSVSAGSRSAISRAGAFIVATIPRLKSSSELYGIELFTNRYGINGKSDIRSVLFGRLIDDIEAVVKRFNSECEKYKAARDADAAIAAAKELVD